MVGKPVKAIDTAEPFPPRGRNLNYEGTQYRCYTLDEYKQIAIDYVNHGQIMLEVSKLELTIQLLDVEKASWRSAAEIGQEQIKGLQLTLESEQEIREQEIKITQQQRWVSITGLIVAIAALGAVGVIEVAK